MPNYVNPCYAPGTGFNMHGLILIPLSRGHSAWLSKTRSRLSDLSKVTQLAKGRTWVQPRGSNSNIQMLNHYGEPPPQMGSILSRVVFNTVKDRMDSGPAKYLLAANSPLYWESQLNVSSARRQAPVRTSEPLAVHQA